MIRNIVFDMGNVLIRFDPELFLSRYPVSEKEKEILRNRVFRTVEWAMMDRGVLDEAQAKKHILPELPDRLQSIACDLIDRWEEPLVPVDGMMDLLRELKKNQYKLYLLSNAGLRYHTYWKNVEASQLMDGTMISADVKLLKPDPQIYELLLKEFALKPEECVFIDDTPINVEGAVYMHMEGIVFNLDVNELREKLRVLGVRI